MYDDIDLKHVGRINFWVGTAAGYIVGVVSILPLIGLLDRLGYADKVFDFFGFK